MTTDSQAARRRSFSIAAKIPLAIVATGLLVMLGVAGVSYWQARDSLVQNAEQKLEAVVANRQAALHMYLDGIVEDLQVQAQSSAVESALVGFTSAWQAIGTEHTETLQRLYITDNPNDLGEKHLLDMADDGSAYSTAHGNYHPWFRSLLLAHDYYDVFLFDMDGNLVYSVFKELDYATNMNTGEWRDTDLANSFRAARDATNVNAAHFFDFAPYAPSYGAPAAFLSTPITDAAGQTIGVLVYQAPIDRFNAVMSGTDGLGETGETYIVGADNLMRSNARGSEETTILNVSVDNAAVTRALSGESGTAFAPGLSGEDAAIAYTPFEFMGTHWAFIGSQDLSEVGAAADDLAMTVGGVAGIATILLLGVGWFVGRGISRPITLLSSRMGELAQGDTAIDVPYEARGDEIGQMARALGVLKAHSIEAIALREAEKEREAEAQRAQRTALENMASTIEAEAERAVEGVSAGANTMAETATNLSQISREMQSNAQAVAAASEESLASAETVAAAIEEMSTSIDQIRGRAEHSSTVANEAKQISDETSQIVASLADAANEIGEVVALISQIAEQTNLLALNATIEAARAGDAGKGFAVVASEVKGLATQTQRSTGDISAHVATVQAVTKQAVDAIARIQQTVEDMNSSASDINTTVEQQAEAAREITHSVQQAAAGAREVAQQITEVTRQTGEADQLAGAVASTAKELREAVDGMDSALKQAVRAAVG